MNGLKPVIIWLGIQTETVAELAGELAALLNSPKEAHHGPETQPASPKGER